MTIRVPECAFENMNFDWSESWLAGTEKAGKMVGDDQNPCIGIKDGSGKPATKTAALESPLYNPDIAYIFTTQMQPFLFLMIFLRNCLLDSK